MYSETNPEFFRRWGGSNPRGGVGAPAFIWQNFGDKLHENERNWTQGRRIPSVPPWIRPLDLS